jgi:hypothetical protein
VRGKGIKFSLKKCFSEGSHYALFRHATRFVNTKYWESIEADYKDRLQIIPRQE